MFFLFFQVCVSPGENLGSQKTGASNPFPYNNALFKAVYEIMTYCCLSFGVAGYKGWNSLTSLPISTARIYSSGDSGFFVLLGKPSGDIYLLVLSDV